MRIAFHAPLKSPDHPVPSGDRLMARLLIEAMRLAGHTVFVASQFRGYAASPEEFAQRRSAGEAAATELVAMWRGATPPELFFCYHPYYKAPDFLGPRLSATFGIPYVTAEASLSSRRRIGPWAAAQEVVEHGLRHASLNLCFTRRDFEGLLGVVGKDRLAMIPPFIDTSAFAVPAVRRNAAPADDGGDDACRRQAGELSDAGSRARRLPGPAVDADDRR